MSIQEIGAISSIQDKTEITELSFNNNAVDELGFSALFTQGVTKINNHIITANENLEKLALGKEISTHELMISLEQAKFELELGLAVKNKLVEAYQEVMRMQL